MARVELNQVTKQFGTVNVVNEFSLEIQNQEFLVLLGPSGCGKTTTLRMVAGLEEPTTGGITIGDTDVTHLAPKDRDIAMVFQNYALYPHMSVYENMAFGLKMRRTPRPEIDRRVTGVAQILGLGELLNRKPKELSGGQRQRVALGRAIVREPKVFLMDEPLSNLDAKLRTQTRVELKRLHQQLGATIVYVTHDQTEAMTLGTRIVVMRDGVIQQVDTPDGIYNRPVNTFVATFVGTPPMNLIHGTVSRSGDVTKFNVEGQRIECPVPLVTALSALNDSRVILGFRPEDVSILEDEIVPEGHVSLRATVRVVEPLGHETMIYCEVGDASVVVRADNSWQGKAGDLLLLGLDSARIHAFDPSTEVALLAGPGHEARDVSNVGVVT